MEHKKSYYAIIPASVRYDKSLTPNAKLLYGEITALCNEKGYCWANNHYFAELYEVDKSTISRWISQLAKKGYLTSEFKYKKGTKQIENRYLKISTPIGKIADTPTQDDVDPTDKDEGTPIGKKSKDSTTSLNTTTNKRERKEPAPSKKPDKKTKYGDFVKLTDEQLEKLHDDFGKQVIDDYIENVNNYIGSSGRKYKSHYHTIRAWLSKDNIRAGSHLEVGQPSIQDKLDQSNEDIKKKLGME